MRKTISMIAVLLLAAGARAGAQEMSVSTNLMGYVNLGTMNLETSWGFARHWTANAGIRYNPFTFPG